MGYHSDSKPSGVCLHFIWALNVFKRWVYICKSVSRPTAGTPVVLWQRMLLVLNRGRLFYALFLFSPRLRWCQHTFIFCCICLHGKTKKFIGSRIFFYFTECNTLYIYTHHWEQSPLIVALSLVISLKILLFYGKNEIMVAEMQNSTRKKKVEGITYEYYKN